MKVDNKIIWIYWKNNISTYAKLNAKNIAPTPKLIGGSISACDAMLANGEEQIVIMPQLLGISANAQDFNTKLANYWHNIVAEVPSEGRSLEIGFIYDVKSSIKRDYITAINNSISKESDKLKTDDDLTNYIDSRMEDVFKDFERGMVDANKMVDEKTKDKTINVLYRNKYIKLVEIESERYKLGSPINAQDYMLYRYCLVYRDVANELSLSDKSQNIRFYLHSQKDLDLHKKEQLKLQKDRIGAFKFATKSLSNIDDVLFALGFGEFAVKEDDTEKYMKLEDYSKDSATTTKFISTAMDENLTIVANIERYITAGLITRIGGSSIIVDAADTSITLGNTMSETVSFFKGDENKVRVGEYSNRLKALPKLQPQS